MTSSFFQLFSFSICHPERIPYNGGKDKGNKRLFIHHVLWLKEHLRLGVRYNQVINMSNSQEFIINDRTMPTDNWLKIGYLLSIGDEKGAASITKIVDSFEEMKQDLLFLLKENEEYPGEFFRKFSPLAFINRMPAAFRHENINYGLSPR